MASKGLSVTLFCVTKAEFTGGQTAYEVLGVFPDATNRQLRSAWRRSARRTHPDHGGDAAQFHEVAQAWRAVGDADARAEYDRALNTDRSAINGSAASTNSARTRSQRSRSASRSRQRNSSPTVEYFPPLSTGPLQVPVASLSASGKMSSTGTTGEVTVDAGMAHRVVHGTPRKPGLFTGRRQAALREDTVKMLRRDVATALPATRIFQDLRIRTSSLGTVRVDTVVLCGTRAAVISDISVPADAYRWTGPELKSPARTVRLPDAGTPVAAVQHLLADVEVGGFVVVHSRDLNPHAPQIEPTGSPLARSVLTDTPGNPMNAARAIKLFLGTGDAAYRVDRHLMGTLISALVQ